MHGALVHRNSVVRRVRYAGLIRRWLSPRGYRAIGAGS